MKEFQFLLPDGSYATTDRTRFSRAYSTGAIPIEAIPDIQVLSPQGVLETRPHREASSLIQTQGYRMVKQARPLRFVTPDGQLSDVRLGMESDAFALGGELVLKNISDSKPLTTDLPRDPKIAAEPPDSPFGNWFGPLPKSPESLKGWEAYKTIVARNQKGKAGFWESVAPTAYNIPFYGVGKEAVDVGKAVITANRIRDGKPVSDQDVLDMNLYLTELDRQSKAGIPGKVGKTFVDMLTFMSEIGVSTGLAALAGAGLAGGAEAIGGKMTVSASRKLLSKLWEDKMTDWVRRKAINRFGADAGEWLAKGHVKAGMKVLLSLPEIASTTIAPTIGQIGAEAIMTSAAGQPMGTRKGNQDRLFAALNGEDMDSTAALWRGIGDTTIENWSESMGDLLSTGFKKVTGLGAIGEAISSNIDRWVLAAGVTGERGLKTAAKAKGLAVIGTWIGKNMAKGKPFPAVVKQLQDYGYHGVIGEMLEERAGDFIRGLVGMQGQPDDNALIRAITESIPTVEQAKVELLAFSMPLALLGGAHLAANARSLDQWFRDAETMDAALRMNKNYQPFKDGKYNAQHEETLLPGYKRMMERYRLWDTEQGPIASGFNKLLEMAQFRYIAGSGLVSNPDIRYSETMSVQVAEVGNRERARYLEDWKKEHPKEEPPKAVLDQADEAGARFAIRHTAGLNSFVLLFRDSEPGEKESQAHIDGWKSANPGKEVPQQVLDEAQEIRDRLHKDGTGATTIERAEKFGFDKHTLDIWSAAGMLKIDENSGQIYLRDPSTVSATESEAIADAMILLGKDEKAKRLLSDKTRPKGVTDIGGTYFQQVKDTAAAIELARAMTPAAAAKLELDQNVFLERGKPIGEDKKNKEEFIAFLGDRPAYDALVAKVRERDPNAERATFTDWMELKKGRSRLWLGDTDLANAAPGSLERLFVDYMDGHISDLAERSRARFLLFGGTDQAQVDTDLSPLKGWLDLRRNGKIILKGDALKRNGDADGVSYRVDWARRDPKTGNKFFMLQRIDKGVETRAYVPADQAELEKNYGKPERLAVGFTPYTHVEGNFEEMRDHLHATNYFGLRLMELREQHPGMTDNELLRKYIDHRDVMRTGVVQALRDKNGNRIFRQTIGALSSATGFWFNPRRMSGSEGYHVTEDALEVLLRELAVGPDWKSSVANLKAALPRTYAAFTAAVAEARASLRAAEKNARGFGEASRARRALASLNELPDLSGTDDDNVPGFIEFFSKYFARYDNGFSNADTINFRPQTAGFKALLENSTSLKAANLKAELDRVIPQELRRPLDYKRRAEAPKEAGAETSAAAKAPAQERMVPVSQERGKSAVNTPAADIESITGYAPAEAKRPAAARLKLKNGAEVFSEDVDTVARAKAAFEKKKNAPPAGKAKPSPTAAKAAPSPAVPKLDFSKRTYETAPAGEQAEFDAAVDAWSAGKDLTARQAAMLVAWSDPDTTGTITPGTLSAEGYVRHPDGHLSKSPVKKPAAAAPAEEEGEMAPPVKEEKAAGKPEEISPPVSEEVPEEEVPPPVSAESVGEEEDTSGEETVPPPEDASTPDERKAQWLSAFDNDEELPEGMSSERAPEIPIIDTGLPPEAFDYSGSNKAALDAAMDAALNGPLKVRVGGRPITAEAAGKTTKVGKYVLSQVQLEGAMRHLASMDPRTAAQLDSFFGAIVNMSATMGDKLLSREKALEIVADRSRGRLTPNDLVNLFRAAMSTSGGLKAMIKAREAPLRDSEADFEGAPETDDETTVRAEQREDLPGDEDNDPVETESLADSETDDPEPGVASEAPDSYLAMKLKDAKLLQALRLQLPALTVLESMLGLDVTAWALVRFQLKHGYGIDGRRPAFAASPEAHRLASAEAVKRGRFAALAQSPISYAYQAIEMDLLSKPYEDMLETLKLVQGIVPIRDILFNSDKFGVPKSSSDPSRQPLTRLLRSGAKSITAGNEAFLAKFSELMAPWRGKKGWRLAPGYKALFTDTGHELRLAELNRLLTHVLLSNVRNNLKLALGEKAMLAALYHWNSTSSIRDSLTKMLARLMEIHDVLASGNRVEATKLLRRFVRDQAKVDYFRGQTLGTHLEKPHITRLRGRVGRGNQTFLMSSSPMLTWAIKSGRVAQLARMRGIRDNRGRLIPFTRVSVDQFRRFFKELVRERFADFRAGNDLGIPVFLVPATKISTLVAVETPISKLFEGEEVPKDFDAFYSRLLAEDGPWNRESEKIWREAYVDPVSASASPESMKQFLKRSDLLTTTLVPLSYDVAGGVKTEAGPDGDHYVKVAVVDGDLGDGNGLAPANRVKELEVSSRADRSGNTKPGGTLKIQALYFDGKGGAFVGKMAVHSPEALVRLRYSEGEGAGPTSGEMVDIANELGENRGVVIVLGKTSAKFIYGVKEAESFTVRGRAVKTYLIPSRAVGVSAALRQDTDGTRNQVISNQVTTTQAYAFRRQMAAFIEATYAANVEDRLRLLGENGWTIEAQRQVSDNLRETNSGVSAFIDTHGIKAAQENPLVWQHVVNGLVRAFAARAGAWRTGRTGVGNVAANVPTAPGKVPSNGAKIVRLADGRRAIEPGSELFLAAPESVNGVFYAGHAAYALTKAERAINARHRELYTEPLIAELRDRFIPEEWSRPLLESLDTYRATTARDLLFSDKTLPFHSEQEARQFLAWLQARGVAPDLARTNPETGAPMVEERSSGASWSEYTGEFVTPDALLPVTKDGKEVLGVRISGTRSLDMRIPCEGPASGTVTIRSFDTGNATHLSHAVQDALSGGDGDGDLLHLRAFDPHDPASWKPFGLFRAMLESAAAQGWNPAGTGIGPDVFLDAVEGYSQARAERVASAESRLPHTFEASLLRVRSAQMAESMGMAIISSSGNAHLAEMMVPYAAAVEGKAELRRTWHGERTMIAGRPAPVQRREGDSTMKSERDRLASGLNNTILDYANNLERAGKVGLEPWQLPILYYSVHALEVPEFANTEGLAGEALDKARMAHVANHTVLAVLNFLERTRVGQEWSASKRAAWSNLRGAEHVQGLSRAKTSADKMKAWKRHLGAIQAQEIARLDKQISAQRKLKDDAAVEELVARRKAAVSAGAEALDTIRFLYAVDGQASEAFDYMYLRRLVDKMEIRSYSDLLKARALVAKFKYGSAAEEFGLGGGSQLQSRPGGYQDDPLVMQTIRLAESILDDLTTRGFPARLDPAERVADAIVSAANSLWKENPSEPNKAQIALMSMTSGPEASAVLLENRRALEQALNNLYAIGAAMRMRGYDAGDFAALHKSAGERVDAAMESGPLVDNALLASLDLSQAEVGREESETGKKTLISATVEDSPKAATERHAAWDALPPDLQIDLFELFTREHGIMPGVNGTLVEWLSPAFLHRLQPHLAESREAIKTLLTAETLLRDAASTTRKRGAVIEMLLGPAAGYESMYGGRGLKDVLIKMPHMAILEKRLAEVIDQGADVSVVKRADGYYATVGVEPEARVSEGVARRLVERANARPKPVAEVAQPAAAEAAPAPAKAEQPARFDAADLFVAIQEAGLSQRAYDATFRLMPTDAVPAASPDAARFLALNAVTVDEDLDEDTKEELRIALEPAKVEAWGESAELAPELERYRNGDREQIVYDADRALRVAHFKKLGLDRANSTVDLLKRNLLSPDYDTRQLAWSDVSRAAKEFRRLRMTSRRNEQERKMADEETRQLGILESLVPQLQRVEKKTLRDYETTGDLFAAVPEREGMSADKTDFQVGIGWVDPGTNAVHLLELYDEEERDTEHDMIDRDISPLADRFRVYKSGEILWTSKPESEDAMFAVEDAVLKKIRPMRKTKVFTHRTMGGEPVSFRPPETPVGPLGLSAEFAAPGENKDTFSSRLRDGKPDPGYDLKNPASRINREAMVVAAPSAEESARAPSEATQQQVQESLGLGNVLVYYKPHPAFPDAGAVVHAREGIIYVRDPAALPQTLATYILETIGESNPMLSATLAPDIAQALIPTVRSKYAGSALSSLLEAELARRLSGATSLFEYKTSWAHELALDLADRAENGLRQLLAEARLVRKGNRLEVAPTESARQLAPAERSLSPNDSLPWDKASTAKLVPEALRDRLSRTPGPQHAAREIMGAADRGEIDDVLEDILLRSAFESLPAPMFPGGIDDPQTRLGMSVDSIYFHDYGSRAALLKHMGIPAMHLAYYESMNAIHAAEINSGSWQETMRMLLEHNSQWLHKVDTDKNGFRGLNRGEKVPLSRYERQLLIRLEYAVTALMEHADQFDLDDPAILKQIYSKDTIAYGRFQPKYVQGSEVPEGTLPEFDTIGNVLKEFASSGLQAKMLDPKIGGRTAEELDIVRLAKETRRQYLDAAVDMNNLTADFLNGGTFIETRERFAPHFYGWAPALDPEGNEADRTIARMLKYADPAKSMLKRGDGSVDDSARDKHQGTVPDWTEVQQNLLQGLDPKAYARGKALEKVDHNGHRIGGPNVVQANRMLINAIRKHLYDVVSKHLTSSAAPGEWAPDEESQKYLATLKHLLDLMRRYRFVESSPAEFSREHDTFVSAYVGDGTLEQPDRDLRPRTMSFIDLHREYMDRVYAAAAHKAVLNAYLGFTDIDGRPLVMAQPAPNIDLDHSAIKRETWERYAANVANYYGDKFDPQGDLVGQLRDLYSKHASKNATEVIVSPKMPSVQQWSVIGKNAARLLKNVVGLSPTDTHALARAAISAAAWTKTMSFGWSAFFYTSLAESSVSFSGTWKRNIIKQLFTNPKELKAFWSDVKAFREHRRYYRPAVAQKIKYLVDMGLTSSGPAASEQYIGQFQRDMASLSHWMAEKYGKQNADRFMWLLFGDKTETGWRKWWPGATGAKMSQWMFDWFSAIKEAQTDAYVKQLAAEQGFDTGHLVSWNQARFLINDSNNVMGGQNWARYIKWTPMVKFLANVFFLAPNWCCPQDTRAMTKTGFKFHHELEIGDEVLVFDPETKATRWSPLKDKFVNNDYEGDMVHIGSIAMTPEHTCFVMDQSGKCSVVKAKELKPGHQIPLFKNEKIGGFVACDRAIIRRFSGGIWCPSVETGFWVAERNGLMFITGNTLSAWNASGLGFLTQALFGTYMDPGQARRTWMDYNPAMALWVMLLTPAAIQATMYAIGQAFGGDPDDVPFPLMNEPGRKQYVDITPLVRLFPNYKGGLTGKRRAYIQFAKQVHETGLSNPFGDRGWINEPLDQAMRKLSQPVKLIYEQLTGLSPGSDWTLEFNGKGALGLITSGEPGAKGFMTSRIGYVLQKFIPMSWSQFIQNPETFPFNHLAPTSKGASQSKIIDNIAAVLATYASARDWHKIRQVPRARAVLDSLVPEFLRGARMNGYNPDKVLTAAKGLILGDLYATMWQALNEDDEALMKQTAASIWRVGGALQGLKSSVSNKEQSFGRQPAPEQEQTALDAMNWAMYGND